MNLNHIENFLFGKNVLEIGGPSRLLNFLYKKIKSLDILNFPASMEKHSQVGEFDGTMYLGDATDENHLKRLNKKYDAILTSHTLEHIANPIKTINLWRNYLTNDGVIVNILPNKNQCWDRNREYTSFDHLMDDYLQNVSENDLTHLHESSCMVETKPSYYNEVGENNLYRIIHHHCFDVETLKKIHEFDNMYHTETCYIADDDNLQLIYVGRKK
jgi:hypothetical protein